MPHVQFTLRRLLLAIALLAFIMCLTVGAHKLLKRRERFIELAEAHASRRDDFGEGRGSNCFKDEFYNGNVLKTEVVHYLDELHDHYAALEKKYRYAASHPWIETEPDAEPPCYHFKSAEVELRRRGR
jgi:hypothetical protein